MTTFFNVRKEVIKGKEAIYDMCKARNCLLMVSTPFGDLPLDIERFRDFALIDDTEAHTFIYPDSPVPYGHVWLGK